MTELIACLSSGKGTWEHITRLINSREWEKVYLITDEFGLKNFNNANRAEMIMIDTNMLLMDLTNDIVAKLKLKIIKTEVALNLISGSGKEHMAILSALLKIGVGIRLVAMTPQGVKEV